MAGRKKSIVTPTKSDSDILMELKKFWEDTEANYAIDFSDFKKKLFTLPSLYSNEYDVSICNGLSHFQFSDGYGYRKTSNVFSSDKEWVSHNSLISVSVITGGVSGGSCWDDSDPQPFETNNTISYSNLEDVLRKIITSIIGNPYVKIDDILKDIYNSNKYVEHSYSDYEYYGNSTDYSLYYIKIWDLYTILSEKHCF